MPPYFCNKNIPAIVSCKSDADVDMNRTSQLTSGTPDVVSDELEQMHVRVGLLNSTVVLQKSVQFLCDEAI